MIPIPAPSQFDAPSKYTCHILSRCTAILFPSTYIIFGCSEVNSAMKFAKTCPLMEVQGLY